MALIISALALYLPASEGISKWPAAGTPRPAKLHTDTASAARQHQKQQELERCITQREEAARLAAEAAKVHASARHRCFSRVLSPDGAGCMEDDAWQEVEQAQLNLAQASGLQGV